MSPKGIYEHHCCRWDGLGGGQFQGLGHLPDVCVFHREQLADFRDWLRQFSGKYLVLES